MQKLAWCTAVCIFLSIVTFKSKATDNTVFLRGKIQGYNATSDGELHLDLLAIDDIGPTKFQILVSVSGDFELTANVKSNQEFIVKYNGRRLSLILNSGDSILIEFDRRFFFESPTNSEWVSVKGRSLFPNQQILDRSKWNSAAFELISELEIESGLMVFNQKKLLQLSTLKADFEKQFETVTHQDSVIRSWFFGQLEYKAANALCFYPFAGQLRKDLPDTSKYFDFIRTISFEANKFNYTEAFQNYVQLFVADMQIICNINPQYAEAKRRAINGDPGVSSPLGLYLDIIKKKSTGQGRSRLIAYLYNSQFKQCNSSRATLDSISKYVNHDVMNRIVVLNSPDALYLSECVNSFEGSEASKTRLRELLSELKNKTVYVSFLLKGCGPCEVELPKYAELERSISSDVALLFLGTSFDGEEWKKLVRKYKLGSHNLNLTLPELTFFIHYFELDSYPKHSLIRKDGKIITKNVPGLRNASATPLVKQFIESQSAR